MANRVAYDKLRSGQTFRMDSGYYLTGVFVKWCGTYNGMSMGIAMVDGRERTITYASHRSVVLLED